MATTPTPPKLPSLPAYLEAHAALATVRGELRDAEAKLAEYRATLERERDPDERPAIKRTINQARHDCQKLEDRVREAVKVLGDAAVEVREDFAEVLRQQKKKVKDLRDAFVRLLMKSPGYEVTQLAMSDDFGPWIRGFIDLFPAGFDWGARTFPTSLTTALIMAAVDANIIGKWAHHKDDHKDENERELAGRQREDMNLLESVQPPEGWSGYRTRRFEREEQQQKRSRAARRQQRMVEMYGRD